LSFADRIAGFGTALVARAVGAVVASYRAQYLETRERVYRGAQYEGRGLAPAWDKTPPGTKPAPLRQQKPSVQYDLPRLLVDRPAALLFGEGRFPEIAFEPAQSTTKTDDEAPDDSGDVTAWFAAIADEGCLQEEALIAAKQGLATGTMVLTWAVRDGLFDFRALQAKHCRPTFSKKRRRDLESLELRYRFQKEVREIRDGREVCVVREFWYREEWTTTAHVVYAEVAVESDGRDPTWTVEDRAEHGFGFVPAVWIKSQDDGSCSIDGVSMLEGVDNTVDDIDRTLSQKSRAIRYNQDPERVYYGLSDEQRLKIERSAPGNSVSLPKKSEGGGAELLELAGEGQRVAEEHVQNQRNRTLETKRVVVPDPDKLKAAGKSGIALKILHAVMLELIGELRLSYGRGLRTLFQQICRAVREGKLGGTDTALETPAPVIPAGKVTLLWGDAFELTPADLLDLAQAASTLYSAGLMDRETIVRSLASYFGVRDVQAVLDHIEEEQADGYGAMLKRPGNPPPGTDPSKDPPDDGEDKKEAA